MNIKIKRVYDNPYMKDGFRILIDRLWPRGLSKDSAKIDVWMKDVAPSKKLRMWFHADKIKRLSEFEKRYQKELDETRSIDGLKNMIRDKKPVMLVTAVKDFGFSHIPVLLSALKKK